MDVYWFEQTERDVPLDDDWLTAGEAEQLRSLSIPKRRSDWRLGRWTAKRAVARYLSFAPGALAEIELQAAPSGAPELHLKSDVDVPSISLTHSAGVAACALAPRQANVGCDLETIEARGGGFITDYFTNSEQRVIAVASPTDQALLATLLWSAKESALKALRLGLRVDTRSVEVSLPQSSDGKVRGLPGGHMDWQPLQVCYRDDQVFHGWWRADRGLVRTLVATPPTFPPRRLADHRDTTTNNRSGTVFCNSK